MSFFNKKEEVLDLQLTQFGKQLLSQGKFKPLYYSFFDTNILYDSSFSGIEGERTIDIEDRIQEETPYCKTQYVFSSRETAMKSFIESNKTRLANQPDNVVISFANPSETSYTQFPPLGNSELGNKNFPNFSVTFLNGEISGNVNTAYSSSYSVQKIPQINSTIKFTIKPYTSYSDVLKKQGQFPAQTIFEEIKTEFPPTLFSDNSVISVTHDYILLQIMENNVEYEKENFDILPFLVEEITGSTVSTAISSSYEQLVPLPFEKIFIDQNVGFSNTPDFIEHFFKILIDDEIPEEIICSSIKRLKKLDYQLDDDFDCEDKQVQQINIYGSNIADEDIEQC